MTGLPTKNPWIEWLHPVAAPRLRLLCFPYAGGAPTAFASWRDQFPSDVALGAVALPGRGRRLTEAPLEDMDAIIEAILKTVAGQCDLPTVFFGHSMGALVAFETVRALARGGHPLPRHVIVSGCHAPQLPSPWPPMSALPDDAFLAKLQDFNGTPRELLEHEELMALVLPGLRADFAACEHYVHRPAPALPCPLTVFGGLADPDLGRDALDAWATHTTGPFDVRLFAGDHFFLHQSEAPVLWALRSLLD